MAVSNVQIANLALQKLGVSRKLESLDQDHPNARTMNLAFEPTRRALLRSYDWAFAIKRDSIAEDGDSVVWGDWNQYSLPNDFLRLIRDDESGVDVDWKIEGLFILSATTAPLEIRYIADITDPNHFDAIFVDAFATKLAHVCAEEVTQSTQKMLNMEADFNDVIAEARRQGAIERGAVSFPEDDWVLARL